MRVLQCPIEIAGQMGILSKGLQEKGIISEAYNYFHTYLSYRDFVHNIDGYELEMLALDAIESFDLFHFHYAATMMPEFADLPRIKALKKRMVMHHWGNDVRTHAIASLHNPYVNTDDSPPPAQVDATLKKLSAYIDHAIVQDYEVLPYVELYYKHVHILPIAFDVRSVIPQYPSTLNINPLVIHAPTNPKFKGTVYIEAAVNRLKAEGFTFQYQRIEHMSNAQALQFYQKADIVIDQILCGSYGMLAVESMSLGKPVIGYIRENLRSSFPEVPPIISANPDQIYEVLKHLILYPTTRNELGIKGRAYVEKYHDIHVVTDQLLKIYSQL